MVFISTSTVVVTVLLIKVMYRISAPALASCYFWQIQLWKNFQLYFRIGIFRQLQCTDIIYSQK